MTMKANVEKLKREINLGKEKLRLKNRTKGEKGIDFFHKWRRFALLSGVKVLGKIGVAATVRSHVVSPIEGAMGWLASKTKFGKGARLSSGTKNRLVQKRWRMDWSITER